MRTKRVHRIVKKIKSNEDKAIIGRCRGTKYNQLVSGKQEVYGFITEAEANSLQKVLWALNAK